MSLVKAARDASSEAGEAHQAMARLKRLVILFDAAVLLPYLVLVVARAGHGSVATGVTIRVIIQAAVSVVFIVVVNGFLEEQLACGSGVAPDGTRSVDRFGVPLGGVAGLFILALVIAGGNALLPVAWLGAFFQWLSSRPVRGGPFTMPPYSAFDTGPKIAPMPLPQLPTVTPSRIMESIWHILAIIAVVCAALGVVFFIVRPLLSRSTRRAARGLHPLRFLKERAIRVLRTLTDLPRRIGARLRASGRGIRGIPRAILEGVRESVGENRGEAARGQGRLKASGRALREFQRIARWGARAGVHFTAREGPMEYVRKLAACTPEKALALQEAAVLVEQLIYGESPTGDGERALSRVVNGIVK